MENTIRKHTISVEDNKKVNLSGLIGVVSIFDKEIELLSNDNRIVIKGSGLTASKLNIEDGTMVIHGDFISSVNYLPKIKKISFKGIFK